MSVKKWFEPELDMTLDEISTLFKHKGWIWDIDGDARSPEPPDIADLLGMLTTMLENDESDTAWASLGRFNVFKDPEFPGSYGVCLDIGYIQKPEAE